jgi:nitrogen regulatory protein PII
MELLVCVINQEEKLEEILSGFLDLGVTGATVIKSEGMGRVLANGVPQTLMSRSRPQNVTIFSVIESKRTLEAAIDMVQAICGDFGGPSTGIVFTVPVERVIGLAPELQSDSK